MIIFGSRGSKIGDLNIKGTTCSHCGQQDTQHISVFGRYFHVFWIPILAIGKKVYAECTHCKKTIEENAFPPELKQQYQAQSAQVKRPIWHSLGCLGVAAIIGINIVLGIIAMIWGVNQKTDTRDTLLRADLKKMIASPTFEADSVSFKLKQTFDKLDASTLNPSTFEYYTTVENNKILVLLKVPDLKKVPQEKRVHLTNIVEKLLDKQAGLAGKERYIGVHGTLNMMMIKTPSKEDNANLVISTPLWNFYGEKTVEK